MEEKKADEKQDEIVEKVEPTSENESEKNKEAVEDGASDEQKAEEIHEMPDFVDGDKDVEPVSALETYKRKHNKDHIVLLVIMLLLAVSNLLHYSSAQSLRAQVENQQDQIEELAEFNNYDLKEHKQIKTLSQINTDSKAFRSSEYFTNHKLDDNLSLDKTFNLQADSYYVIFYAETCSHCNELESDMYDKISDILGKDIFYYDADSFTDDSGFEWTQKEPDSKYTTSKREFKLYGTPTMVKVSPKTEQIKVFMGNDAIEKELQID